MIKYFCDRCGKETDDTHICEECEYEELTCGFKVGDKVITDDGRTGTITSICDCERCKKRGFYEPKVKMDIGVCQIWITDTDKENGFKSFYQIGDRVFGSVDTEASEYIRERITELEYEAIQYKAQLNMVKKLENSNEI